MIKKDMYKTGTPFIREINSGNIFQIITGMVILPEPVYVFLNISPKPIKYKGIGKKRRNESFLKKIYVKKSIAINNTADIHLSDMEKSLL